MTEEPDLEDRLQSIAEQLYTANLIARAAFAYEKNEEAWQDFIAEVDERLAVDKINQSRGGV